MNRTAEKTMIAATVAAGLLAALPALGADAAMIQYVMPEAKVIAGGDVGRVMSSPFGQFLLAQMEDEDRAFQELMAATGFDPRRDLRQVLAASNSPAHGAQSLVVARGVFDEVKITAMASVHGGLVRQHNGVKVITPRSEGKGHSGSIAFAGDGLIVAGPSEQVLAAIDRQRAGQRPAAELAARILSAASSYDAWLVTTSSPAALAGRVPNSTAGGAMRGNVIEAIEYVSGGLRFGAEVQLAGEAMTRSERDATALIDVVRFLGSMAASNAPQGSPFARMYESLQLSAIGTAVRFSLVAPQEEIEKLFKPRRRNIRTKKVVYNRQQDCRILVSAV